MDFQRGRCYTVPAAGKADTFAKAVIFMLTMTDLALRLLIGSAAAIYAAVLVKLYKFIKGIA